MMGRIATKAAAAGMASRRRRHFRCKVSHMGLLCCLEQGLFVEFSVVCFLAVVPVIAFVKYG
jgi:hypothetical protein